jgi:tRNA (mo5U34)-methyltransferase
MTTLTSRSQSTETIPEPSPNERQVADLLPIGADPDTAAQVRDSVPVWFHTFSLGNGIYTPGIARDHRYRIPALTEERFRGRSVLDIGTFDGFYAFLAERLGASRVVAIDNEQYVDWIEGRFGVSLPPAAGFNAIHELLSSKVDYRRLDAIDVGALEFHFDVILCFGMLHRVTDPVGVLRVLADQLNPGGEVLLETYGSKRDQSSRTLDVYLPDEVYPGDDFVYWGFPVEGLRRLGAIVGLDEIDVIDTVEIAGHPRLIASLRKTA